MAPTPSSKSITKKLATALDNLQQTLSQVQNTGLPAKANIEFPNFIGRHDPKTWRQFLKDWNKAANACGFTEFRCCQFLPLYLKLEALSFYESLDDATKHDWKALCDAIATKLYNENSFTAVSAQLHRRVQGANETSAEYGAAVRELVAVAFSAPRGFSDENRTELGKQYFLSGLCPLIKKRLLRTRGLGTLDECIDVASEEERIQEDLQRSRIKDEQQAEKVKAEIMAKQNETKIAELRTQLQKANSGSAVINTIATFANSQNPVPLHCDAYDPNCDEDAEEAWQHAGYHHEENDVEDETPLMENETWPEENFTEEQWDKTEDPYEEENFDDEHWYETGDPCDEEYFAYEECGENDDQCDDEDYDPGEWNHTAHPHGFE